MDASKNVDVDKKTLKVRCRKKKLLNLIQEQLEFYFSDINLNHDRFLRKQIEESNDGYVAFSTMLKCNKLKQLTSDNALLGKAVGNSPVLELNEDHMKVRRKTELLELQNTDSRTVYVEEFPLNIDHDWLKLVFSKCGNVEYISLPKFKHNNQAKGFAFIEFSTPGEAQKACHMLNTIQCKNKKRLSTECRNNEDGVAKKKSNRKRRSNSDGENSGITNQQNTKRRRSISESSEGSPVKVNRRKRHSSFCSIEETNVENKASSVEKPETKINAKHDLLSSSTKGRRSRDASVSSEGENKQVKIKSFESSKQKLDINLPVTVQTPSLLPSSRKRKASGEKENEISEGKILKTSKSCKDVKPPVDLKENKANDHPHGKDTSSVQVDDSQNNKTCESQDKVNESQIEGGSNVKTSDSQAKATNSQDKIDPGDQTVPYKANLPNDNPHSDTQSMAHKRKSNATCDNKEDKSSRKKIKQDETSIHNEIINKGSSKQSASEDKEESLNVEKENNMNKKKNRQHRKKGEKNSDEISVPPLHVIPKSEWLTLKKEYKRLQHIEMSELKRNLKLLKSEKVRRTEQRIIKSISTKTEGTESTKEKKEKHVDTEEKENYQDLETPTVETEKINTGNIDMKPKGLKVTSGTVVALKTSSENLTKKDIKTTLSVFGQVAYLDYVDGLCHGFVRFVGTSDVEKVMAVSSEDKESWVFQLRKLSNDEENKYFQKAEEDRIKKYDKDQRKKKKKCRGVDKITRDVENVSNHVHFT